MYQTNEFRKNLKIEYEGSLWAIVDAQFKARQRGRLLPSQAQALDGRQVQVNFRSGDKVGKPDVMDVKMQLYTDGESWHFMDNKSYDQIEVPVSDLGDRAQYLKERLEVSLAVQWPHRRYRTTQLH